MALLGSSDNQIGILIKSNADISGIDKASGAVGRLGGITTKNAAIMGAFAGVAQNVVAKSMDIVSSSIQGAIARVDTLNNAQRTFQNIGFGAEETAKAMKALDGSIRGLPTSLDEAVRGMTQISASNNDITKAQKVYSALNDAIIGFGGNTAMVSNAVTQLSQDLGTGRITAQTWLSLTNSGLTPALAAMARQMGITTKELKSGLSDGSISVDQFQAALIELDQKGGGGMKSLHKVAMDATAGIGTGMANAKTAITRGIANIIQSIGSRNISDAIGGFGKGFESALNSMAGFTKGAVEVAKQVFDYLSPSLQALWNTLETRLIPSLMNFWKKVIEPLVPVIGGALVVALQLTIDTLNAVLTAITPLINFMANNRWIVYGMAAAFIALKAAMMFNQVFNALTIGFNTFNLITIPKAMASMTAFRALVASPMVMGAIGVGVAVAAILFVHQKLKEFRADVEKTMNDTVKAAESQSAAIVKLRNLARNGTPEQRTRALSSLSRLGYAKGGFTGRGGVNEVAGVVHRGEFVLPQSMVDQSTGMPKNQPSQTSVTIQGVYLQTAQAAKQFFSEINNDGILASKGLTVRQGA